MCITLFYNAHTGKIGFPLCNLLNRSDSGTRGGKNNYKYISTRSTAFSQSFFPKTRKDCNKIDNETKESSTTLEFTNSIWTSPVVDTAVSTCVVSSANVLRSDGMQSADDIPMTAGVCSSVNAPSVKMT